MAPSYQGSTNAQERPISIACIPILGTLSGATECKLIVVSSFSSSPWSKVFLSSFSSFFFLRACPFNAHSNRPRPLSSHFSSTCHFDDRKFLTMATPPPTTRRSKRQAAAASNKAPNNTSSSPARKVARRTPTNKKKQKQNRKKAPPRPRPSESNKENDPPRSRRPPER